MLLDSHTHFDMILEDKKISEEEMINSIKENNIEYSVQVSIETKGFSWSRDFAKRNHKAGVYYTLGIHPSSNADDASLEKLSAFTEKEMNSDEDHEQSVSFHRAINESVSAGKHKYSEDRNKRRIILRGNPEAKAAGRYSKYRTAEILKACS